MRTESYIGTTAVANGAAGEESFISMFNPAASPVIAYVNRIWLVTTEDSGILNVRHHTATQGTDAFTASGNVFLGGVATQLTLRGDQAAAVSGTIIGALQVTAAAQEEFVFTRPYVIMPGVSLVIEAPTAQRAFTRFIVEWDEVYYPV